ncbi:MAG: hypothetical protein QOE82_3184 [Thermoanaerobaculia bacterium]|jgi:hypothetical protein|nr:hypothetical protein [Thermoanaerobaculia bacterium]
MYTKILMIAAALVLGLLGVVALFAPQELLTYLSTSPAGLLPTLVQLLGAALFGLAMTDWMIRGSKVGGIYNRPIAMGNLIQFVVGAITLIRSTAHGPVPAAIIALAVVYTLFAIAFGVVVFGRGDA